MSREFSFILYACTPDNCYYILYCSDSTYSSFETAKQAAAQCEISKVGEHDRTLTMVMEKNAALQNDDHLWLIGEMLAEEGRRHFNS